MDVCILYFNYYFFVYIFLNWNITFYTYANSICLEESRKYLYTCDFDIPGGFLLLVCNYITFLHSHLIHTYIHFPFVRISLFCSFTLPLFHS